MRASILILAVTLCACRPRPATSPTGGDPHKGAQNLARLGCGSCHTIPGIVGAHGKVGPTLAGVRERSYIAGELPNQPRNLEYWIEHPHSVHPRTVMPEFGVSPAESIDIAAYLYSLE